MNNLPFTKLKWMTDSDINLTIVCRHHWTSPSADEDRSVG